MLLMALMVPWAAAQSQVLSEDFDAMTTISTSYSATDWYAYNAGSGNNWSLNTTASYAHSGSNSACYNYNSYNDANCYLVSAPFTVSAKMDELGVSVYEAVRSSSYSETFEVFFVKASDITDAASVATATQYSVIASASYNNATFAEVTGSNSNSALAGQSVRIVVHCTSVADRWALYIDDITVTETLAESCPKPKNLEATNITNESATLTWTTSEAPSNGFNVRYRTGEIANPTFFDDFESGLSQWTTLANDYDGSGTNWRQFNVDGFNSPSLTNHSGSYVAMSRSYDGDDHSVDNWLITPQVALNGTLKFWAINDDAAGYPEHYSIYVSTTGNDITDFTEIYVPADCTEWTEYSIDLSSYSGALGYIAIRHIDEAKDFLFIDDFGIYGDSTPAGSWVNTTSNTNSKDINGLTENTLYEFEVQSNCGGETSTWAASTFTTLPSCMPVANLAVSDATTTTISLTWTDQNSGAASYIVTDGDDNPVTVTNLTITGCTVTGLTANTAYTFKVTADCGSTAESINARTDCNALSTLPYEEGFEASSVNMYCWDLDGFDRLNNNTYAHTGDASIYSQEALAYAILPATTTNISDLMLNFWWYNAASGYDLGSLAVGYLTDETDYSTFVTVGTIDMSNSTNTYTKSDDFFFTGAPAGARIALKYTEGSAGAQVIIDDVTVDVAPSCVKPTNLGANPSDVSADLNWTANSGETTWTIYYKKTSDTDYTEVKNVTDNPYTLTPLVANTNYEYYVVANCSATETSDPSAVYSFKTPCGSITTLPWDEDFEGMTANTVPECWDNSASTAQEISTHPEYIWGVYNYNSNNMIRMYNYYVHSGSALINSPAIELPSTGVYQLTFDYSNLANAGAFKVNISDDNGTSWVEKGSYPQGSTTNSTDPGTFTSADPILLGDYAGKTIVIQFFANANYGSGAIFVDNILINEAPNCIAPNGLGADASTTSAELSWTANSGETSWNIYYKKTSETDYTELKKVTDNPYTLPGLDPATDYEFYVVANCTATETSDPSSVYYFSTECAAFTITATNKYTQDFESPVVTSTYSSTTDLKLPNCWENPYTTGTSAAGKPHLIAKGSSYNYSSNQVLNFYGSGSNYVTLPEFTNDLQDLQISFKWATESSSNGTLTLGYITDGDVNYNTFTAITGASYPASASSYQTLIQADPVELSALPTTAKRLAFRWVYSGQYSCNVDDLVVELIPSCKIPTGLTCTDYTATTATFDWTATGTNQTAWQLYISDKNIAPANDIAASEVINVTTKPYTVSTGLVAEQTYYAWVRGNCTASSEGYSEWTEGIEFMPSQYKDFTYQETAGSYTSYLPVYGSYVSYATNKGQMLIPASAFPVEMADATVRRLTFYTTNSYATVDWGEAAFDVLVTEVDATSFETAAFFDWDDMTTVYSGSLSVSGNKMVIELATPFSYTGGNLVIGFNLTKQGTNASVSWVGTYGSNYYGAYQYNTSSVNRSYYQIKTTFNYLPNPTPRPINPHATEELSTEATVAWTVPNSTEVTGYQYQYKLATATEWPTTLTDEPGLSATISGLTPEETYDFRVRAVYPGPAYSQYAETQFTTTAACAIPDGLAAANITMNTADLTWNASVEVANYTVEYRTAAGNSGNMLNEDFTGLTSGIPADWDNSEGSTTSASYKWSYYNNGHDAAPCLRFNSYMNSNNNTNFLKTPSMDFPAGKTMQLIFWWKNPTGGDFSVYISTDGGTTKTALKEGLTGQSSWKEETIDLTGYEGASNVTIHFKGTSNYGSGDAYIYLDEVIIGQVNTAGTWTAATTTAPNTGEYTIGGLTAGTKYDVRVYANCTTNPDGESTTTTITTLADGTMVFNNASGDGMWSTAANWTPNVPTIADNAILRADATITGAAAAKKITIEGTNTLTINDGGQLKTNNAVAATVKKHIDGYGSANTNTNVGYYLIANPMSSTVYYSSFATVGLTSGTYDLYRWSYSNDLEWSNYKDTQFSLATQTGYLYANESDVDLTFTGTVVANNTDVTKSLNYSSGTYDFNGWNLVGNPFACNAYVKEGSSGVAYYRMNTAGNGFTAATGAIAPMEGIFVQATAASQSFKFTRTNPEANPGNGNLNISLAQTVTTRGEQGDTDNAIVRFNNGNTLEKFSFRGNTAKVYIPQDGKDYAVVNAEAQGELPVYFKTYSNGNYTLSFTAQDVDFSYLHLVDNLTGNDVDLLATPSYNFDARFTDYAARFKLVFCKGNANGEDNFGFISDGQLILTGLTGGETLQVIDALGRVIVSTNAFNHISTDNMAPGVYVLRLINGNDVKTQKIVVR